METKITKMLEIEYPILCGGLFGLSEWKLVSSVCNAGALAFLSSNHLGSSKALREQIIETRKHTNKPFGVNISLLAESKTNLTDDYIDVIIEEKIPVVETAGNNPSIYIERLKKNNIKVLHKAVAPRFAQKAEEAGADGVILVGYAAGGHPGMKELDLFVNLQETLQRVNIPVIAAGGIGTGQAMAAALRLGAEGILMGTVFAATQESIFSKEVKERILNSDCTDTVVVFKSLKNAFRCLKTRQSLKILELEQNGAPAKEILSYMHSYNARESYGTNNVENALIPAGQVVGLIHKILTCQELVKAIIKEYEACCIHNI